MRSDKRNSGGTGIDVKDSSSSEQWEVADGAADGGISTGARSWAADSCSLRTPISSFASGIYAGLRIKTEHIN